MAEPDNSAGKHGGRFVKGRSGNPAGKPKGARHKTTVMAEKLMATDATAVVEATIAAAIAGDMTAARIILDRVSPVRRGRSIEIDLPEIRSASDLVAAAGAITTAVASGKLTPEEALTLGGVVELQRRAIETADLAKRLDILEGKTGGSSGHS